MDVEPAPKKLPPRPVDAATSGNQKVTVVEVKASRDSTPKGLSTDSHVSAFEREVTPSPRRANAFPRPPRARYWSPSGRPLTPNPYTSFEDEQRYFAEQEQQDDNERRVIYDRPPDISSEGLQKSFHQENSALPAHSLGVPTASSGALEVQRPDIHSADAKSHDHISHVSALPSARESVAVRPHTESQPQKQGAKLESNAPPAPTIEQLASDVDDIQSSRASSVPPADTNAAIAPAPPVVTPSAQSSIPPDASSMPPPSLKERIEQPTPMPMPTFALPQTKLQTEAAPAAAATATATATATAAAEHHPPAHPERFSKRGKFQKVHHPNGLGRFNRPGTAAESAAAGHGQRTFRPRSPSLDTRKPPRDYRPPRPVSRERGNYRPELHVEPRRPEGVDADAPPPARYEGRPYADYTGSERRPSTYAGSPPPISGGRGPPLEGPPARGDYYPPYPPPSSRGEWEIDDDYYKSRGWDRPPPSTERELFDREVYPPRPGSWDARAEREFLPRDEYSPLAPAVDDRYIPGPPLPREGDRSRPQPGGYPPTYSRIRGRSPSPLGRPGAGPIDDSRPPLKRAREDYPPEYYPSGRAPPARSRPSDYLPPRTGTHGSAVDWPPPPSASSAGMGGGPPAPPVSGGGRDYRMRELPLEYVPAGYNRSPSPLGRQPYPPRGAYARGNDRGGYVMRPRPPS
ncbi:hypothetical protein BDN70DRAFT_48392 [Pholiota conissans]|uniref:Uncharacterized protein n=1 Tax=Pholiota conissans TaxID=109636 RepID=A0A9P5Z2P1_9AGAR|nr:hypothetical protein BDN70DRAFT_48392 [Pholiota conissans]